jgi:hypothetical protein
MKVAEDEHVTVVFFRSLAHHHQEVLRDEGKGKGPHTLSHSPLYCDEQWYALPALVLDKEQPGHTE